MNWGRCGGALSAGARFCGDCGVRVPPELTMLGKTLLNLDLVGRTVDPDFDPNAGIPRNAADITIADVNQSNGVIHVVDAVLVPE